MMLGSILFSSFILAPCAFSAPKKKKCKTRSSSCSFDSAESPNCWGQYSIDTNYYNVFPKTGMTREYFFDVQEGTAAFDGFERDVMTINAHFPGPTIEADWGDEIVVHVTNSVSNNGTSIHFHGVRQYLTNDQDGVASVTQCPLAFGETMTYEWQANQYGHSWYHSHYALQAWNGVMGGIVIRGPVTAPYDEDKGILILSDWFHDTTDSLWQYTAKRGKPPVAQNGLINGINVYGDSGKRFETDFISGERHRFRIVNAAMDTFYDFSIDNHSLTVVANDFVPIEPFTTDVLRIGMGQRYDVIVEANQPEDSYWMRAVPNTACSAENESQDNIRGIVRYDISSTAYPTSTAYVVPVGCLDEPMNSLVPKLSLDVEAPALTNQWDLGFSTSTQSKLFTWTLNDHAFLEIGVYAFIDDILALEQILNGTSVFETSESVVQIDQKDSFVYFVIQNALGLPLGENANYTSDVSLELKNPPRRDVAMLAPDGYLVIAFVTDNPGVWLMHCHIGWHASQGFALQIVERQSEIPDIVNSSAIRDTCATWISYQGGDT
ncbi:multicopper oxidase [Truncatella angustata]|uniref:Multicopper oxidase n=1 Tax=Truncatella angustata TaxID=152316 RepID=A0A9P8ZXJ6_9PEZI|nr:multicopper oxidase [Truncatella angustata]KAH6654064.1 multicopper oxidase [Truncatella angustata]